MLERADGSQEIVGNKVESVRAKAGDLLHFITWGGGGWGDPLARDPELVGLEIRQGLVTPEGARAYGVVAEAEGGWMLPQPTRCAPIAGRKPASPPPFSRSGRPCGRRRNERRCARD